MIKCTRKYKEDVEKARERMQEDLRKEREREKASWKRSGGRARERTQSQSSNFWEEFARKADNCYSGRQRSSHPSGASSVSVKVVSPAAQWDHLPDKQKHGQVLGIQGGTQITKQAIRDLYKKRMLEYHPDKCARLGTVIQKVSHEMTIRIQEAYEYFQRAYGI